MNILHAFFLYVVNISQLRELTYLIILFVFHQKLHVMLSKVEDDGLSDIVSW